MTPISAIEAMRQPDDAAATLCGRCRERIGSYEPMVLVVGDTATRTSRLVAGADALRGAACYHAECWEGAVR